jgi:hypothetical protein
MKTLIKTLTCAVLVSSVITFNTFAQNVPQDQQPAQQQAPPMLNTMPNTMQASPNQEESTIETLFGEKVSYSIVPMLKATNMNNTWGTLLGIHAGAVLNKNILIGVATYATFGHESVNMGYTGLVVEYRTAPHRLLHFGGSMLIGYGAASTMRPNSFRPFGLVENAVRLFSANFFVLEPSAFGEVNLSPSVAFSLGASYRYIAGYSETLGAALTNANLSGISVNTGVRFRINDNSAPVVNPVQ